MQFAAEDGDTFGEADDAGTAATGSCGNCMPPRPSSRTSTRSIPSPYVRTTVASVASAALRRSSTGGLKFTSPSVRSGRDHGIGRSAAPVTNGPAAPSSRSGPVHPSDGEEEASDACGSGEQEESTGALPANWHLLPWFPHPGGLARTAAAARVADAFAERHGLALPRFALTQGRLHSLESTSWMRPPGPGETSATIGFG
ncbi:hypothetical protein ACRJ4B_15830 [Streptomyces sp. GTA36]